MKIDLQLRYGVVRARGTSSYNTGHELVFQSNDAFEAMKELEWLAGQNEENFTYMLIIRNDTDQERRQRTQDRRGLQDRREGVRAEPQRRRNFEERRAQNR